ncbi:MAG TPA: M20/M25/M40 family metallo-hydrolase [Anaerolineales bacterium]|nr:M20/M25/M40 family metallo-hydrolase [Anaerolineales bacterium]
MQNIVDRIVDLAIQIQQIPAPTFHESKRAEFVRNSFVEEGLQDVMIDDVGNVYGFLVQNERQRQDTKPLIVSAHLDTVFPLETDLSVKREDDKVYGVGIGDNSLGVAGLFGLIWMLRERHVDYADAPLGAKHGDIWFVANVGEEGLGDLRGMKAVADRFGEDVLAYLVLEGMALGHVYHKAVGVKRYRITATTQGGHSWSDYGQPSAVLELTRLIRQMTSLRLPSRPRTTMNVGKINGGTSINVIPAEAWLELDLRSEGPDELADLVERVERLIEGAGRPGVRIEAKVIGERPAGELSPRHPLIKLAQTCLHKQGLDTALTSGSTDANIPLSRGYPALVLGVTKGGGAHTKNEFIEVQPLEKGLQQLVRFFEMVWE